MTSEPDLPIRRLLLQTLAATVGLVVGLGVASYFFGHALRAWGEAFLGRAGGPGLAAIIGIGDATGAPLPPEAFFGLALAGGMPSGEVLGWAAVGSLVGGWVAYAATSWLRHVPAVEVRLRARSAEAAALLQRYGVVAVIIELISPVPFSLIAWASGLLGVRPSVFLVLSLLRLVRHALFIGLVGTGLSSG